MVKSDVRIVVDLTYVASVWSFWRLLYMIVDLKVHVEIVHYKGCQGSNMRPREIFFLSSWK